MAARRITSPRLLEVNPIVDTVNHDVVARCDLVFPVLAVKAQRFSVCVAYPFAA
jgi:hypothetical protein